MRATLLVTSLVGFLACRQVLGVDDLPPDAPLLDAGPSNDAADAGSPFTVFHGLPDGEALLGIWGSGKDFFVAVGTSLTSYFYDHGVLTKLGGNQHGRDYLAVWGRSTTDIFAVGQTTAGAGFVQHYDGVAWVTVFETKHALFSIWGSPEKQSPVIVVGDDGKMYGSSVGTPWTEVNTLGPEPSATARPRLSGVSGRNAADFAVTGERRFYHYEPDAGGLAFYSPDQYKDTLFRSVWQAPGTDTSLFLGTNFFGLLWFSAKPKRSEEYTVSVLFRDEATPGAATRFMNGVWGTAEKVIAVGDDGRIVTYEVGIGTSSTIPSPTDEGLGAVWGSSLDDVWIVGARELILHGSIR